MNRETLFARLAPQHRSKVTSPGGRETRLVGLEPLEDRKMLVATVYVNDDWINLDNPGGPVSIGDFVQSPGSDGVFIIAEYGWDAFGTVEGSTASGAATISDAIAATDVGGTLNILNGTYRESDIVVNKAITIRGATGSFSSTLVPEVVSSKANAENFGVGTHSGIIIYSPNVTIEHLILNGNGNNSLGGSMHYHHGITTLYDFQDGGNYASVRNGNLAPSNMGDHNAFTDIMVRNVTVSNTWWHGITISGLSGVNIRGNRIHDVTVSNVGEAGFRDLNRVGILLQNQYDAEVLRSSVSNTGVGIASQTLGPASWGSSEFARNRSGMRLNTVTDADQRAYSVVNFDGLFDLNFILDPNTMFRGFNANSAIYTSTSNNATGLYITNSDALVIGYESINAKIGAKIENTTLDGLRLPVFAAAEITGPGAAVSGSYGVLIDNEGDPTNSAAFGIAGTTFISGFETGIRINQQTTVPGSPSLMQIDRPDLTGNTIAISVGNNSVMQGNITSNGAVVTTGNGRIEPGFPESFFVVESPGGDPPNWAGPYADISNNGNVSFSSGSTFSPWITGMTGSTTLFDFNENVDFEFGLIPPVPVDGRTEFPNGTTFLPGQSGQAGGQLFIGNGAFNGPLNLAYNTLNHPDPENEDLFILDPVDISGFSHLDFKVKLGAANQARGFIFGLVDITGQIGFFTFPMDDLSSVSYSTLTLNLAAPGIPVSLGDEGNLDLSNIVGYAFLGDNGLLNGATNVPLDVMFDEVIARGVPNSQLNVTGTVNLNGATLDLPLKDGFTPSISQQFTIINNDGVDPVVGTFNGIANNAVVSINGNDWRVNYDGGTGNDVVVTYLGESGPSAPATVVGRHIFYNQSKFDGNSAAINANDDNAIAPDKVAFNGIGTAPLSAFTNYSRGINGIMVDIEDAAGTLTVNDFTFKVGANNMPSLWANAPAPNGFSVRAGAGVGGSDRVVITWANNAIQNQWLQVIVEGNDALGGFNTNTGLAASDVFFYGNRIGDTFEASPATIVTTNVSDQISVRGNSAFGQPITAFRDFNKDGLVNVNDEIIARSNGGFLTRIINWVPPAAPEAEPAVAGDDSGSAVASALAVQSPALSKVPGWISSRLASVDLNTGTIAKVFTTLAEANTPGTRKLLLAANEVTNALGLDDWLLESLIEDLG